MELALNNFEVLDQTQMEEVDGGITPFGSAFVIAGAVYSIFGTIYDSKAAQAVGTALMTIGAYL